MCVVFLYCHDQSFKRNTLKNIYTRLLIQHSGSGFRSTFILKQRIGSPCILLSIKYYWKNITPAWEVYINNMVSLKRKIRKKDVYRLGDVILIFFRLGDLISYKLISANHKAKKVVCNTLTNSSWNIRGAGLKVDKIVLVRLTLMDMYLI